MNHNKWDIPPYFSESLRLPLGDFMLQETHFEHGLSKKLLNRSGAINAAKFY
jgi:hypothetical protein